jgi:CheY-like chemotaxis protein
MLPRLSGLSVLRALRADAVLRRIPVIVCVGLPRQSEARLRDFGIAAYVEKGITAPELLPATVRQVLAKPWTGD